jgi:DUF4097 and DUF4098 domain-containing protein YvlB
MEISVSSKAMNKTTRRVQFVFATATAVASLGMSLSLLAPQAQASADEQEQGQKQTGGDRVSVALSDPSRPALVKASMVNGGISVKAYNGKEVIVEARTRNGDNERPESGPKRLPISTTGLTVEEENNQVSINTESYARSVDLFISVPVHTSLHLRAVNNGDIAVTGVDGEFDIDDVNGSVTLTNVAGSAVAHALNGRLLATFSHINPQKAMAFSSLNGDVDITFPADLKANVSLRSDRGDVFSDFDVQMQPTAAQPIVEDSRGNGGKYRVKIDKTVKGTINGGGPEMQFTNFNGQIYIRKAGAPR